MPSITLTIPDDKFQAFKDAYIDTYPIPLDEDNNPRYSVNKWIKVNMRDQLIIIEHNYRRNQEIKAIIESSTFKPDEGLILDD